MRRAVAWLLAIGLAGTWLFAAVRLVSLPEHVLAANLVVDDTLYYALPARHWWQGSGYSFDGLEATNGVQTLWALVTLGLAGLFREPLAMLRAMVLVSAACWALAAIGLFALLRRRSVPAAALAAVGMAWCGVHERLAFMGMDNGLHALVAVVVLLVGTEVVAKGWTAKRALWLGSAVALMALARTEGVLLGPIVGAALVFGWLGRDPSGGKLAVARRMRLALTMAVPGVVLVGAVMLFHRVEFGIWLPVSGDVKALYEEQWGGTAAHGGVLGTIGWHLRHALYLALAPLREDLPHALAAVFGSGYRIWRNVMWVLLATSIALAVRQRWRRMRPDEYRGPSFAWCFAAYALLHLLLIGLYLPHFTSYATWYFASEVTVVWLGVGVAFGACRYRLRWLPLVLAVLVSMAGFARSGAIAANVTTNRLRSAGEWLERNAPEGAVVGTLSSGLVGWYAPSLHVVNLDGLINNQRYLEQFLRPMHLAEYFDDKGITWFADYQVLAGWRTGVNWNGNVPAERLVPRRYWRMPNDSAYVVWQVLPRGQTFELLGERNGKDGLRRDRYVELAVAADVHGRFPVVSDAQLAEALQSRPDHVVARSIVDESAGLLHVLVPRSQLEELGFTPDTVEPEHRIACEPVAGVSLLGCDTTCWRRDGDDFVAVALFWNRLERNADGDASTWTLSLCDAGGRDLAVQPAANCHGTLPRVDWQVGRVVVETVVLQSGPFVGEHTLLLRRDGEPACSWPVPPR